MQKKLRVNFFRAFFLIPAAAFLLPGCQKSDPVTPAVIEKYQADADLFCNAIVDCMKDEVREKMKATPERRDLVLSRMTRDNCRKGQYSLIGRLSTDVAARGAADEAGIYREYAECAHAVAEAKDCTQRKQLQKEHPACAKMKAESGY